MTTKPKEDGPQSKSPSSAIRSFLIVFGLVLGLGAGIYFMWVTTGPRSGAQRALQTKNQTKYHTSNPSVEAFENLTPIRPKDPPIPGRDTPTPPKTPKNPPNMELIEQEAYKEALASQKPQPAEAALRKAVSAFVQYNRQFADAQAQAEGLSIKEVEELTYFGILAQRTQNWIEVEDALGAELSLEQRMEADRLLNELNDEFTDTMRKMVSAGATETERWKYIRDMQDRYLEAYYAITEMNQDLLQNLLAGDPNQAYANSELPPPDQLAQQPENLPGPSPERPEDAPLPLEDPDND